MGSIHTLNGVTLSASGLKKLRKDPLVNDNTIVLLDFLRSGCSNGENPSASNYLAKDLSENGYNYTVMNPAAGAVFDGGFSFAAGNTYLAAPEIALTSKSLIISIWYKWAAQVASTAGLIGNLNNALDDGQFGLYCGTSHGTQLKAKIFDDSGVSTGIDNTMIGSHATDDIVHALVSVDIGASETIYKTLYQTDNLSLRVDDSVSVTSAEGLNESIVNMAIGAINANGERGSYRGTVFRHTIENIGDSEAAVIDWAGNEWYKNRGRFS